MQRMDSPEVRDKYFVTYGIFYLMGILTFVPYNFFTTANFYWMFKFRDPRGDKFPEHSGPPNRTPLQVHFTSSFSIVCQVSLMVAMFLAAFYSQKFPPADKRILGALSCTLVFFIANLCFVPINTDSFQEAFFVITVVIAVLLNISSAVTMISLFELVTKFPLGYYSAIMSGQAICGIFSAVAQILTLTVDSRNLVNGFIYFGIGTGIVGFTIIFYYITRKNSKYFIYHIGNGNNHANSNTYTFEIHKVRSALVKIKWYMASLVFVLGSTSMVYPGVTALVVPQAGYIETGDQWIDMYFVPVISFFTFNFCDFVGREIAGRVKKPRNSVSILIMAAARLVLVPLLMLCNAQPRKHMPVIFGDAVYVVLVICFASTNGYLVNLVITTVPLSVSEEEDKKLVTIVTLLFSVVSIAFCSFLSILLINVL